MEPILHPCGLVQSCTTGAPAPEPCGPRQPSCVVRSAPWWTRGPLYLQCQGRVVPGHRTGKRQLLSPGTWTDLPSPPVSPGKSSHGRPGLDPFSAHPYSSVALGTMLGDPEGSREVGHLDTPKALASGLSAGLAPASQPQAPASHLTSQVHFPPVKRTVTSNPVCLSEQRIPTLTPETGASSWLPLGTRGQLPERKGPPGRQTSLRCRGKDSGQQAPSTAAPRGAAP